MGWSKPLTSTYLKMAQEATDKEVRAKAMTAYDLIIKRSPVLNGVYRASHIISTGQPDYSYDPNKTTVDSPDLELPPYPVVFLQTNCVYAHVIENGTINREPVLVYKSAFDAISRD